MVPSYFVAIFISADVSWEKIATQLIKSIFKNKVEILKYFLKIDKVNPARNILPGNKNHIFLFPFKIQFLLLQ